MICENCGKKNATSIFMPPNQTKIKYLCGECYKKFNEDLELEEFAYSQTKIVKIEAVCTACGTTFKEFEKSGLFGCMECYNAFKDYIDSKILINFKEKKYLGKKPNNYYVKKDIENLEHLIEMCLKNGDLTRATKYGEELKSLKDQNYDRL